MTGRSMRRWGVTVVIALALASSCLDASRSYAAANETPADSDLERAFQAVLADPADLDAAFEYARIAAALGDFEAAISSLERILMFEPNLLQVQVELGVLYFRLGSYEAAQSYLKQALDHEDLPPDVRTRVETFLDESERQVSPYRYSVWLIGGLRYQTNANLAPGNRILSFGTPTSLPNEFASDDDFSVFFNGRARYLHDFGGANGDRLEANLGLFASRQFTLDEFDVTYLYCDVGPRIVIPGTDGIAIRPYATASALFVEDAYYQGSGGAGAKLEVPISDDWSASLDASIKYAAYESSVDRPNAEELDGQEAGLIADLTYTFGSGGLTLSGGFAAISARESYETYREYSAGVFVWKAFPAPVDVSGRGLPWIVSLDASLLNRDYSGANPAVSPQVRNDDELRADVKLLVPVTQSASVFAGAGYQDVRSNLPNYTFDNITGMAGFSLRF